MSLPSRERELKRIKICMRRPSDESLPSRERELKLSKTWAKLAQMGRSPRGSVN